MEYGHHGDAGLFKPQAMLTSDLEVGFDEAHGGDPSQTDDDLRPDEGHLVAEVADAGVLLRVQGSRFWGGRHLTMLAMYTFFSRLRSMSSSISSSSWPPRPTKG